MKSQEHDRIYALPKEQQEDFFTAIENEPAFRPRNIISDGYILNQETKLYVDKERKSEKYCFLDVACVNRNSVRQTSKLLEKLAKDKKFDLVRAANICVVGA